MFTIKIFWFNPFAECTYVVSDNDKQTVIIDAGCSTSGEKARLKDYIEQNQLQVKVHMLTHAHLDHLFGARFVYENYHVLPHLHADDTFLFERQAQQAAAFGCPFSDEPLTQFIPIQENDILTFGAISLRVIHTPGHSAGSVCYFVQDGDTQILFSGDTLFAGGEGRTDLPTGNYDALQNSLEQKVLVLPDNTIVYPGHGYDTTIAVERRWHYETKM